MLDLEKDLQQNNYPGRGIVIGRSKDGKNAVIGYFIMGRSENSRNRVFVEEPDGIRTEAFDPAKLSDPSLVIYHPVRRVGDATIVTNGDQTDTIAEFLQKGPDHGASTAFERALRTRTFEPDPPIFTPRISGMVEKNGDYRLSILKSADGDDSSVRRYFFEYTAPRAGEGHLIHTYAADGNPPASFSGEPKAVALDYACINCFTNALWDSLNEANKVSLYTCFINLETGERAHRIVNKNQ